LRRDGASGQNARMIERALLGALAAGIIAAFARRAGLLSESGRWAAFASGTFAAAAGWRWAALLVAFFASSTALTVWHHEEKARRTRAVLAPERQRTAAQVAANGGVFVALAFLAGEPSSPAWTFAASGALAAASADTWSTELGVLYGGAPRSIVTWRAVAPGRSGGVTGLGFVAGLLGAMFIGGLAAAIVAPRWPGLAAATIAGGFVGCVVDSLLGATLQTRRWCGRCREWTERRVHPCGGRTAAVGGIRWLSNDAVNFAATVSGAAVAAATGVRWR
jgi:uncharacterized protein (TIGR00297 family)